MHVNTTIPLKIQARVLKPPTLRYGPTSKQPTIVRSLDPLFCFLIFIYKRYRTMDLGICVSQPFLGRVNVSDSLFRAG